MCDSCSVVNGIQYVKISENTCGECPPLWQSLIKIIEIFIGVLFGIYLLIYFNLRTSQESDTSVILRIATNYFQITTTVGAMNFSWPDSFKSFLGAFDVIGSSMESFISLECFLQQSFFSEKDSSSYYFKAVFVTITPLIMTLIYLIVFKILQLIRGKSKEEYHRWVTVASIVVLFTILPTMTKFLFGLFNCIELDSNEYWLITDLQVKCWEGGHLTYSLAIGFPAILTWIVMVPLLGLALI